jgi:hypothetical protein
MTDALFSTRHMCDSDVPLYHVNRRILDAREALARPMRRNIAGAPAGR